MSRPVIGILTSREGKKFAEPGYFRRLIQEGRTLGAVVYLFSHLDVSIKDRTIRGFVPAAGGGWESRRFPWPDVVIDRCRKGDPDYRKLRRRKDLFLYANQTYTNKWNATQLFLKEDSLKRWMPVTCSYSANNLHDMLNKYRLLYIKPGNGTGGRSIIKLVKGGQGYQLLGRNKNLAKKKLTIKSQSSLVQWLNSWVKNERIRNGNFMIQQGVNLSFIADRVADTRLLIQKDENGKWSVTGLGVRLGGANSSTSNLHGGGRAIPFQRFFTEHFGPEKTQEILKECHALAFEVVKTIENRFGRMMEFGLDIGVDTSGRVWLIEVNPKPGRDIFREMGQTSLYKKSIQRPIQYAMHLVQEKNQQLLENVGS